MQSPLTSWDRFFGEFHIDLSEMRSWEPSRVRRVFDAIAIIVRPRPGEEPMLTHGGRRIAGTSAKAMVAHLGV